MATLLWLQGGACSGNTMSFLNAEEPSACDLVTDFGIDVVWHPSLGVELGDQVKAPMTQSVTPRRRSCRRGQSPQPIWPRSPSGCVVG